MTNCVNAVHGTHYLLLLVPYVYCIPIYVYFHETYMKAKACDNNPSSLTMSHAVMQS